MTKLPYPGNVKQISLLYNKTKLLRDLDRDSTSPLFLGYNVHYPGQYIFAPNAPLFREITHEDPGVRVFIDDIEILKGRNTKKRKCTSYDPKTSFDDMAMHTHIKHHGCSVPYLKNLHGFPICATRKNISGFSYDYSQSRAYHLIPCERCSKIIFNPWEEGDGQEAGSHGLWSFSLIYPDYARLITQSKEVDIHALVGNIGGYVGLFLGNENII